MLLLKVRIIITLNSIIRCREEWAQKYPMRYNSNYDKNVSTNEIKRLMKNQVNKPVESHSMFNMRHPQTWLVETFLTDDSIRNEALIRISPKAMEVKQKGQFQTTPWLQGKSRLRKLLGIQILPELRIQMSREGGRILSRNLWTSL